MRASQAYPMIEPAFAQMKFIGGLGRFKRRGRGPSAPNGTVITATTTSSSSTATPSRPLTPK